MAAAASSQHEPIALHADQHVRVEMPSGSAQLVDIQNSGSRANEHAHFAVTVPAEGRNARRQLVVVFTGQDRVDHESFEPGIPQSACFRGPGVNIRGREGDLARVQQDCFAQHVIVACHALFDDLDRDSDELQGLREAD
jgi:hypothetical protein